ncbi:MAG: HNH endonuclease [Chlorobiales bacterium]|nr:HNH endonuclease [Chlorobiales bacterium]
MLEQFKNWWLTPAPNEPSEIEIARSELYIPELPVLDSYSFIRAGLWWSVLARDNWKCRSCGRSAKENGITLEVDHIIPRSKGGTNDISNLQTLCKKCNIGKSNKDSTDLR